MECEIRKIEPNDDAAIAQVIRTSLEEFGANKPGTVYTDKSTHHLSKVFTHDRSVYYVCFHNRMLVGGAGVFPTEGLNKDTAELVKMYLLKETRGKGLGGKLMNKCIEFARKSGYKYLYIESMPELSKAISMYEKFGFEHISQPLGNSGHFDCTVWMKKDLTLN